MALLEVRSLSKNFGGLAAVSDFDLDVEEGEIRGIIGPNGAGKTTLFNVISGIFRPSGGTINFEGKSIAGKRPSAIAAMGAVRTFQRTALFEEFDTMGNVSIARHLHARETIFGAIIGTARKMERANEKRAEEIIEFIGLGEVKHELAINLSHGHQRALNVAMALAAEPRLLMLDEPVAGMNPSETATMTDIIRSLRKDWGITVILVEHDMRTVMDVCEKITVINFGRKLAEGTPDEIVSNNDVIEAYLGSEDILGEDF